MLQVADQLFRAGRVDAVPGHLALWMLNRLPAGRTGAGWHVRLLVPRARIHHRTDDIGDHFPGAFDQHPVTGTDVFVGDVVEVVQGGAFHDHAADLDRFQYGVGRQHAGAPYVDADMFQLGGHLAGWEFEGDRATRVFAHEPQVGDQV